MLSSNLINPSPGRLRAECLIVYGEKGTPRDDDTLRLFFETKSAEDGYNTIIANVDIDKFRPLVYLLNGRNKNPHVKQFQLLAWLIGFETGTDNLSSEENPPKKKQIEKLRQKITAKPKMVRKTIISLIIFSFAGIGTFLLLNNGNTECMYWTGDHYQAISCNQKISGTTIYALDTLQLNHFKRITTPDTIKSLRGIWYSKIDNVVEFYTADGFHPVHTARKLKPLTDGIREKYILNKNPLPAGNN
ncbi:MAG: hypothetical protein JWR38_5311 [Mucilaginibacter sp.]|nr:hypothetical protein [Mucilaginibacter sp.]